MERYSCKKNPNKQQQQQKQNNNNKNGSDVHSVLMLLNANQPVPTSFPSFLRFSSSVVLSPIFFFQTNIFHIYISSVFVVNAVSQLDSQWGAADAEIKVPSGENTGLKRSPFKAWRMSVHSHTCNAYC